MSQVCFNKHSKKQLLSNTQNFLYFENTSPAYASLNGLRDLSNWLEKPSLSSVEEGNNVVNSPLKRSFSDAECQGAALLCVLNALSHCDSVLNGYSHQMRSWMEVLIRTCQTANGGNNLTSLSLEMSTCALANALRDPGEAFKKTQYYTILNQTKTRLATRSALHEWSGGFRSSETLHRSQN